MSTTSLSLDQSQEFEARLRAQGYVELETKSYEPRPANGLHRHHFAAQGLVLSGTFIVTQDGTPTSYGPGQTFAVAEGEEHCEAVGPDGARVFVGRKY